jgi:hypothetical protein
MVEAMLGGVKMRLLIFTAKAPREQSGTRVGLACFASWR